ncbi:MAG TPA: hypothetical protein VG722_04970 [Tepidisphaeraceae bacterium]|nr:hypothetical protein [Tepidisphaeraceae bacterium]
MNEAKTNTIQNEQTNRVEQADRKLLGEDLAYKPLSISPTPGPYKIKTYRNGYKESWVIVDRTGRDIAYYEFGHECDGRCEEIKTNLRLLAEAPELFCALICMFEAYARLPWSLINGSMGKAAKYAGSIMLRLFGPKGANKYFQCWAECRDDIASRSKRRGLWRKRN